MNEMTPEMYKRLHDNNHYPLFPIEGEVRRWSAVETLGVALLALVELAVITLAVYGLCALLEK